MDTQEQLLTRKECLNIAEAFVRGAFKGISVTERETSCKKSTTFLSRVVTSSVSSDDVSYEDPEQLHFKRRPATLEEIKNGERLTDLMPSLELTSRQAKLLYVRAFHKLSWSTLAKRFKMDWSGVRREYEFSLIIIYKRLT